MTFIFDLAWMLIQQWGVIGLMILFSLSLVVVKSLSALAHWCLEEPN